METNVSPSVRRWIRKCLEDEFGETVQKGLENEKCSYMLSDEIMSSPEMETLLDQMKEAFEEDRDFLSDDNSTIVESRPRTSLSFGSDLSSEDWREQSGSKADKYAYVIEKISYDKPVHVRLAGYERLLESGLSNVGSSESWDILLKTLRDGIADENRPVFESSLRVHGMLLNGSHSHDVYTNLLSAFNAQFHSRKLHDTLPTLNTGINFKVFLHEKLFRLMRLIVHHQEETLKAIRIVDRAAEEMIEQFIVFLSSPTFGNTVQAAKTLNTLNILSILEPQAGWSKKWIHSLATRRVLAAALGKSPSFLQNVISVVSKGLEKPPGSLAFVIMDEPQDVFISGETVETATYLHGLHFLTQLYSFSTGRALLTETPLENSPSFSDFSIALLSSLNTLASSATTNGIYNSSRDALRYMLERSSAFTDARFYHVAVSPLMKSTGEAKIWAHTLDILNQMLVTREGIAVLTGDHRNRSDDSDVPIERYPVIAALEHTSTLLRQPFSVMNLDHVVQLFQFIGRLFGVHEVCTILEKTLERHFFPAVAYLYSKMDKYAVGQESKTQYLDSAAKSMLLKIVSSPFGLRTLISESAVFRELIQGSLAPLRAPWSSNEIVGFVSSAAYFNLGSKILSSLAPQSLSTVLEQVCMTLEDPFNFHDPWDNPELEKFLHVLSCLSLSIKCFVAFMADPGYDDVNEEMSYPRTLRDLIRHAMNADSQFHYLGLLTINALVWNLDICVYLLSECNLQDNMLKLQELCAYEIEEEGESKPTYIIDACSLLRHKILSNSYNIRHKLQEPEKGPEENILFSKFPPPKDAQISSPIPRPSSSSELNQLLQDSKPGLRDSGWVLEARRAHKNSPNPLENSVLINLLDQMRKAIPTSEWADHFKWVNVSQVDKRGWLPEENLCFDLVLHYAEENCPLEDSDAAREDIKIFFQAAHEFIGYRQPDKFQGFDWFLATVFIVCGGKVDRSKVFVEQIIRFPSAMFMWPVFGVAVDQNNGDEVTTQFLFSQHLEDVVDNELSIVNYALKNHCGVHWWMICNRLLSQCFWGILPWNEIVNFIAISILHTADYIVYYCASLLHHSQDRLMEDISNNKYWPDHMTFRNYRCHEHMTFIDRIGKRQRNRVLPSLSQRELIKTDEKTEDQ